MFKSKIFSAIIFVFFVLNSVYGQTATETFKFAIKNNFQFNYQYKQNSYNLWPVSPAFLLRTKSGNAHEFELNRLYLTQNDSRNQGYQNATLNRSFFIVLRYQFNYYFIKEPVKFSPYLATTALAFFQTLKYKPETVGHFEAGNIGTGVVLAIAPGITYNISKRVFLDFNMPLELFGIEYYRHKIENPAWTPVERISSESSSYVPLENSLKFRLGLGVNF